MFWKTALGLEERYTVCTVSKSLNGMSSLNMETQRVCVCVHWNTQLRFPSTSTENMLFDLILIYLLHLPAGSY